MKFLNSRQFVKFVSGIFLVLLFLGALFWAKEQDPFSRKWFTLKTADHGSVKCIAVLPKPMRQYPVIIYAHGSGGSLLNDGNDLRQMAELGLAAISLEYDQTNEATFDTQFERLLRYLGQQRWANTNAISWVGFSLGANRMLDFALQHPKQQPQLLVQLSGVGVEESAGKSEIPDTISTPSTLNPQPLTNLHCPVLLVHGEQDEVFPMENTKRMASILQTNGLSAELKIIPSIPHGMEPERGAVFRSIGEYCRSHLAGTNAWQNYHSIAQWPAEAPPLWIWWLPAAIWAVGWFAWSWHRKVAAPEKIKLSRGEIALRWLAAVLTTWALTETAIHLVTPHFSVNDTTLSIARRFLVQLKQHNDFENLAAQSIWHNQDLPMPASEEEEANEGEHGKEPDGSAEQRGQRWAKEIQPVPPKRVDSDHAVQDLVGDRGRGRGVAGQNVSFVAHILQGIVRIGSMTPLSALHRLPFLAYQRV